jgi:tRNA(Arg) A34 adenosine deaminase TadA
MTREEQFMMEAIRLSGKAVAEKSGGPFGCVVVKGETIIGRGWNQVLVTNDPTAHAEIIAIRNACAQTGNFHLDGCEIFSSCEPCPMCLGAIYWARLGKLYYANTREDAAGIGFSDAYIYGQIQCSHSERTIQSQMLGREEAFKVFGLWARLGDRSLY